LSGSGGITIHNYRGFRGEAIREKGTKRMLFNSEEEKIGKGEQGGGKKNSLAAKEVAFPSKPDLRGWRYQIKDERVWEKQK